MTWRAAALLALAACSSSPPAVDAGALDGPEMALDAAPAIDRAPPIDFPPPADRPPRPDFPSPPAALPLPSGVLPPTRFLGPNAQLTGDGSSSCSNQDPPSGDGDRWCVFTTITGPSASTGELWVVDVTKAAAGLVPKCDGTDPGCVRLTTTLWTGFSFIGPSHPYSHAFVGDTLVFYADAVSGKNEMFRGPVYAWRPGWARPRQLTSGKGFICYGDYAGPLAYCLDDLAGDPMKPDSFEVRAGRLRDAETGPLPSVGRIRPFRMDGEVAWQAGFSPDGATFVLSSPDPDPAVESLRAIATDQIGLTPPREVLANANRWTIANDGRRVYFLRDEREGEFGLLASDFPSGDSIAELASRVTDYLVPASDAVDRGVAFLSVAGLGRQAFRLARDSHSSQSVLTIFTVSGLLEDVHLSDDLRFTAWLNEGFLARVVRHEDLKSCELNLDRELPIFEPLFLASAGLLFWNEDRGEVEDHRDGFYGNPEGCADRQLFALDIDLYAPIGDRGIVYGDGIDDQRTMSTLKYAAASSASGKWRLEPPVLIKQGVNAFFLIGSKPLLTIFRTTEKHPEGAGVHVFQVPL